MSISFPTPDMDGAVLRLRVRVQLALMFRRCRDLLLLLPKLGHRLGRSELGMHLKGSLNANASAKTQRPAPDSKTCERTRSSQVLLRITTNFVLARLPSAVQSARCLKIGTLIREILRSWTKPHAGAVVVSGLASRPHTWEGKSFRIRMLLSYPRVG